jgi:hypothetical protein
MNVMLVHVNTMEGNDVKGTEMLGKCLGQAKAKAIRMLEMNRGCNV